MTTTKQAKVWRAMVLPSGPYKFNAGEWAGVLIPKEFIGKFVEITVRPIRRRGRRVQ